MEVIEVPKYKYPLRRIISERFNRFGRRLETLECGHEIYARTDIVGETNAYRRRCGRCFRLTPEAEEE